MRGRKYKLKKYNAGTQYVDTPNYSALYNMQSKGEGKEAAVDGGLALTQNVAGNFVGQEGKMAMQVGNIAGDLAGNTLFKGSQDEFGIYNTNAKAGAASAAKYGLKGAGTGAAIGNKIVPGGLGAAVGAGVGLVGGGTYGAISGSKQNERLMGTKEGIESKFKFNKQSNKYVVDPNAMQTGDTGVGNLLPQAKNGLQIGKYKYKNGSKWIQTATKKMEEKGTKGAFTKSAKQAGMGTQEYASKVLSNKNRYSTKQVKRASFAKAMGKINK